MTKTRLNYCFDTFWDTIIEPNLNKNESVLVQFKVQFIDKRVRSISYINSVDINSRIKLFENFNLMWELKNDEYYSLQIDSIIFNYKFPSEEKKWNIVKINEPHSLAKVNKSTIDRTRITGYSLPNTMDLKLWGDMVYIPELKLARIERPRSKSVYEIIISENSALLAKKKIHNVSILVVGDTVVQFKYSFKCR